MLAKPRKISVTYIASSKQKQSQDDDAADVLKKLQQKSSDGADEDCPFC